MPRRNGCTHTIVTKREDFVARALELTGGRGCDVVYDSIGKDTFPRSLDCLKPKGLWVSFGNSSGPVPPFELTALKGSLFATRPSLFAYTARRQDLEQNAAELFEMVRAERSRSQSITAIRSSTQPKPIATSRPGERPAPSFSFHKDAMHDDGQEEPITLYFWSTPNGFKISIMLEELGAPYRVEFIDIGKGEQFAPEFLAISPNNRIPAIVDPEGPDGQPLAIFESGAILQYLGRKFGALLSVERTRQG